ncbi:hypothetical protein D3880_14930 [Pseudomonas cavernae]|uniref:PA2779 family protein n=2 Tax=Pseudomonas cavernae TaxID=2320867 RepID=A0A385Z9X7_9PSED|nr:hypothetical protein D3880_14930 [Pseudomonas cavernae]
MKTLAMTFVALLLLTCLTASLPLPAEAAMVSTQEAVAAQMLQEDRDKVRDFLDRATVQEKMKVMGIDATLAKSRVDALTAQELASLAQRIDTLPAGGALSTMDIVIILLIAILIAIAV